MKKWFINNEKRDFRFYVNCKVRFINGAQTQHMLPYQNSLTRITPKAVLLLAIPGSQGRKIVQN